MVNLDLEDFFKNKVFPWNSKVFLQIQNKVLVKSAAPKDIINKQVAEDIRKICLNGIQKNPIEDELDFENEKQFISHFFDKSNFSIEKLDRNFDVATVNTDLEIFYANIENVDTDLRKKLKKLEIQAFYGRFKLI